MALRGDTLPVQVSRSPSISSSSATDLVPGVVRVANSQTVTVWIDVELPSGGRTQASFIRLRDPPGVESALGPVMTLPSALSARDRQGLDLANPLWGRVERTAEHLVATILKMVFGTASCAIHFVPRKGKLLGAAFTLVAELSALGTAVSRWATEMRVAPDTAPTAGQQGTLARGVAVVRAVQTENIVREDTWVVVGPVF